MWGELTDVCEMRSEAACDHAEELMRQAATEFLDIANDTSELAAYADQWTQRIASEGLLST